MNPTISVSNIGVDHNVFNDPPDKLPKEDFTFTVTPVDRLLAARSARRGSTATPERNDQLVSEVLERAERQHQLQAGLDRAGFPHVVQDRRDVSQRARPARLRNRHARRAQGDRLQRRARLPRAVEVLSSASRRAAQAQREFDEDAEYQWTNLQTVAEPCRPSTYGVNFRHQLTPLTSIMFSVTRTRTRSSTLSPDRNTDVDVGAHDGELSRPRRC